MPASTRDVDFVAYDQRGQPVLLAEVKSSYKTSEQWAARFRRNLLAHGTLPQAPYFMIATPEQIYFWRQAPLIASEELPQFTLETKNHLRTYFEKFQQGPEKITEQTLELILLLWLRDISAFGKPRAKKDPELSWLSESGFVDALSAARIELNAVQ